MRRWFGKVGRRIGFRDGDEKMLVRRVIEIDSVRYLDGEYASCHMLYTDKTRCTRRGS